MDAEYSEVQFSTTFSIDVHIDGFKEIEMGLYNRFKKARAAEKKAKARKDTPVKVDELDADVDAGDALEAEILAELDDEQERKKPT